MLEEVQEDFFEWFVTGYFKNELVVVKEYLSYYPYLELNGLPR
jgi:hypothetical protein